MAAGTHHAGGRVAHRIIEDVRYDEEHPAIAANRRYRWGILIGLVVSAILEIMDTSILNVALPKMAGSLGCTMDDIAWVSTAYLLANVVVLPMTAWLAQRFGRKNYLVACVAIFSISRLMCAFSPTLGLVILWRLIQGGAGAALISTAQAVLVDIFPAEQQGMVQALFGIGLVVAPAVAPLVGGWVVHSSWQVLFYIHVPIALLSMYLIVALYRDASTPESRAVAGKVDVPGLALLAVGLGSLQYVLEEGQRYDWFGDVWITRITIIAVIGIIAMIVWELWPANKAPVVNLRIYGNRGLWSAVIISFMTGVGMYGVNYAFSIFIQNVLGFTSMKTGEAMIPMGIGAMVSLMIVAAISNVVDTRIQITVGIVACAIGSWMLGFNSQMTGLEHTWLPLALVGFGCGGAIMPVSIAAFAAVNAGQSADASAQLGLGRQLGGSFGIAIINTYVSHMNDFHRTSISQHLTLSNQTFTHSMIGLAGMLAPHGYHGVIARKAALTLFSQMVSLESAIRAYNSGFQLVAVMFACCLPLVFLLKSPRRVEADVKPVNSLV